MPMSLWLTVRALNSTTGKSESLELPPGYHLMGFESFRQELWGTDIMKALGLELLPSLGDGAYLVLDTPEQIAQLEHEAELIRDNIDKVLQALGPDLVYSLERTYLRNLFNAVTVARSVDGEISIG
jgi:hypothetical protein